MSKFLVYFLFTLAFLCLALGWFLSGYLTIGFSLLILIPICLFLIERKFSPAPGLTLVVLFLFAATGLWRGLNLALPLAGVLCALAAWDLDSFSRRLLFASDEDHPLLIERQHLLRLGLILFLGLAINLLSFSIRFAFSFEGSLVLAFITFAGIGALVNRLRNREE